MLDDWCELCDTQFPREHLKPRRVVNKHGFFVLEGFVCIDEQQCLALIEARQWLAEETEAKNLRARERGI